MDTLVILGLQLVLSLIVYGLIAKWYVTPWLKEKPIHQALTPLIFPHAFRHIGQSGRRAKRAPARLSGGCAVGRIPL